MEALIVTVRMLVDQGRLNYKMADIVRTIEMGADCSYIWN